MLLPDAALALGYSIANCGGWMTSLLKLLKEQSVQIAVASSYEGKKMLKKEIDGIVYYYMPFGVLNKSCSSKQEELWKIVAHDFAPDVVHIHGTEFDNGIGYIRANGGGKVVISIQGLMNAIQQYEHAGMSFSEKLKSITFGATYRFFRNVINRNTNRSQIEFEYLNSVNYVMGRTEWDKSYVTTINPQIEYFHCGEILRSSFYLSRKWEYNSCKEQSIFVSGGTPWLKGLYFLVCALPIVLMKYPNTKVFVAGDDFLHHSSWFGRQKLTIDQRCIYNKAKKLGVLDCFVFKGVLSEQQMCQEYLNANLFISPSTIENSSNAICEAQILGCPVVASYVGGTPSLVDEGRTGYLYRFDDIRSLASCIISVFDDSQQSEVPVVELRHDKQFIVNNLIDIYRIVGGL